MFAAGGSVVFKRRYRGSKMSGCGAVVKSTSPVLVREMLNENGEAAYVNVIEDGEAAKVICAACGFTFGSVGGRGKTGSGTS